MTHTPSPPVIAEVRQSRHDPREWTVILSDGSALVAATHELLSPHRLNALAGRAVAPNSTTAWQRQLNALMAPLRERRSA